MVNFSHIFISYKTEQRDLAYLIRDKLQEWGYETWLDVDRLQPGTYWANEIDAALKTCSVCVGIMTPESLQSRYVTNEWDMVIMQRNLFIPLMMEFTEPHYKYIDIQYIDFTNAHDSAYEMLRERLLEAQNPLSGIVKLDPYTNYLAELYERINTYLDAKLIKSLKNPEGNSEPIKLATKRTEGLVKSDYQKSEVIDPLFQIGGIANIPPENFKDFSTAFNYYDNRVLLLGSPGSGKTITLLHYARDAIVKRYQDPSAPLPVLCIVPTWDADHQTPFSDWIASSYGTPIEVGRLIESGQTLLLLDGLDELGEERESNVDNRKYDPRRRFIESLPDNNIIILTCRLDDYFSIGDKANLNGAVMLQPLSYKDLETYLETYPQLLNMIKNDIRIASWLDTPLLLSLFAFALEELSKSELAELGKLSESSLLNKIFYAYVAKIFEHEARKISSQLKYTIDDIYEILGTIAIQNVTESTNPNNVFFYQDFVGVIADESSINSFIEILIKLRIFIRDTDKSVRFIHILLRDHFVAHRAIQLINHPNGWFRFGAARAIRKIKDRSAIVHIRRLMTDEDADVRMSAVRTLGVIGDSEDIDLLFKVVQFDDDQSLKYQAIESIGKIGGDISLPYLKILSKSSDPIIQMFAKKALNYIMHSDKEQ